MAAWAEATLRGVVQRLTRCERPWAACDKRCGNFRALRCQAGLDCTVTNDGTTIDLLGVAPKSGMVGGRSYASLDRHSRTLELQQLASVQANLDWERDTLDWLIQTRVRQLHH